MKKNLFQTITRALGSSRLALVLIGILIFISAAGALLPQKGQATAEQIARWKSEHPAVGAIAAPLDLFDIFHSYIFLALVAAIGINTLTCTLLRAQAIGWDSVFRGPSRVKNSGFIVLHGSLVVLIAAGFITAATSMEGFVVLTEGQAFTESHDTYNAISEGRFRGDAHRGFTIYQDRVELVHEQKRFLTAARSHIIIGERDGTTTRGTININYPLDYRGMAITLSQYGYSPRLKVTHERTGEVVMDTFMALNTTEFDRELTYHDFFTLPIRGDMDRVYITLFPDHEVRGGMPAKTGDDPVNPVLLVEAEGMSRRRAPVGFVGPGGSISLGEYRLAFTDLRRWNSLKLMEDPGYLLIIIAFWIAVAGMVVRYIPVFQKKAASKGETP